MAHAEPNRLNVRQRLWITGSITLLCLPQVLHLPLWLGGLAILIYGWQWLSAWRDAPKPNFMVRISLIVGVVAIVLTSFGQLNGLEAGSALLVLMLGLKLSEIQHYRDGILVLSLGYFVLITQCLFSQSLAMIGYLVVGCWLLTALLVDLNCGPDGPRPGILLKTSGRLLMQAAPIAAVLFVLFPRIPAPLWGLPADGGATARTGLSDTMRPGSISRLVRSDEVALRARFPKGLPPPQARYWRGPVLWRFTDGAWRIGEIPRKFPKPTIVVHPGNITNVQILLAPTKSDWLIALDIPISSSITEARLTGGATLVATQSSIGPRRYRARSATRAIMQPQLPLLIRHYATALPDNINPRARALAARWRQTADSPRAIIQRALALFHNQPFVYTLTPTRTGQHNSIDRFLFETREGFCEHYASAFTFLMRAAGLPARVVTGYLGGTPSTVGDYWLVRSSDAHAWSEVWLRGAGWVRIDPTAAVAPQRVQTGIAAALADDSALPYMTRSTGSVWYRLQMLWDGINTGWSRWFLAYGPKLQARFLSLLGLTNWRDILFTLTGLVVGILVLLSIWLAWQTRRPAPTDPIQRAWLSLCKRLGRRGFDRAPHEGPQAYCNRIIRQRPDWRKTLVPLTRQYIALRYADQGNTATRRRFVREVARFRPRK